LFALFKIRNALTKANGLWHLALLDILDLINFRRFHLLSGHISVEQLHSGRDIPIVDIVTVIEQVYVIPTGVGQWIVNYKIDLWIFNKVY